MAGRSRRAHGALIALVAAFTVPAVPAAAAAPPPPPNPSDQELRASSAEARGAAERVGSLANQVAQAKAALTSAQLELAARYDEVAAAMRKVRSTRAAAATARTAAKSARAEVDIAINQVRQAQQALDAFTAASFRQGSTIGSVGAYLGSDNPQDLLARASLLNAVGGSRLNALENLQRAMASKANADATARAAAQDAVDKQREAEQAKAESTRAYEAAVANEKATERRNAELLERKEALEVQFAQAQQGLAELEGQRRAYNDWQARRRAEQAVAATRDRVPTTGPPAPRPAPQAHAARPGGAVAPVAGTITSTYGPRWGSIHYGLDIANNIGTPIVSVMDGVVISSGPASGFGLWVRVRHDNGDITVYGHINETLVYVGQRVVAGQQIATVGNRGNSTGPHLHFEVHNNGSKIDPLLWLRANGAMI